MWGWGHGARLLNALGMAVLQGLLESLKLCVLNREVTSGEQRALGPVWESSGCGFEVV